MNNSVPPERAPQVGPSVVEWFNTLGAQRYGDHLLLVLVAVGVIWVGQANLSGLVPTSLDVNTLAPASPLTATAIPNPGFILVNSVAGPVPGASTRLTRLTELHTYIPDRSRLGITSYTAQVGDTVLGIAAKFGLTPETIVFGNPILNDNPHFLEPGQTLRIAPKDGIIRDVIQGDTLGGLARAYKVQPDDIIKWASNNIDPDNPQIVAGQTIFVPGGTRGLLSFPDASKPQTSTGAAGGSTPGSTGGTSQQPKSTAPLVLRSGVGQCPGGYTGGVVGSGNFIFPTDHHYISGYDYSVIHPGIDLSGNNGDPVYAADSGVVVFAGWSDWGYGNTIVIDHGHSWWSLYGHLSQIFVQCGQGVYRASQIGNVGATGKAQGAHLHFEIYYGAFQTNPWSVLPTP